GFAASSPRDEGVTSAAPTSRSRKLERLTGRSPSARRRSLMRAHRRALTLGVLTVGVVAALTAVAVSIATGRGGHDGAVFARAAKLTTSARETGQGLSLDGASLVASRASGKHVLGTLGAGDEVIAPLTGALTPVAV